MKLKTQKLAWDETGTILTATYEKIGKVETFDTTKATHVDADAKRNGWKQRLGDLESGDKTGAAKHAAFCRYRDHLYNGGEWEMQAERDTVTEVCEAVARIMPEFSVEDLQKAAKVDPDQVADWRADARVKHEIAKARAKRAAEAAKAAPKEILKIRGLD